MNDARETTMKKVLPWPVLGAGVLILFFSTPWAMWTQTPSPWGAEIACLAVKGDTVFAGSHECGIYRSTDNGNHWTSSNTGISASASRVCAVYGGQVYVGTDNGLFRSNDFGASWLAVDSQLINFRDAGVVLSFAAAGNVILGGTSGGVFRSTNGGGHWDYVQFSNLMLVCALAISGSSIFAGADASGVLLSVDSGNTWKTVFRDDMTIVMALATAGGIVFAGTNKGMLRSTDGGAHWTGDDPGSGLNQIAVYAICVLGDTVYTGTNRGVFFSADKGGTWTPINKGLPGLNVRALAVSATALFAGTENGIFRSFNRGATWSPVNDGWKSRMAVKTLASCGNTLYSVAVSISGNGLFRSTSNGASWIKTDPGITGVNEWPLDFTSFAQAGGSVFAGTGYGVLRSTDNGQTWDSTGLPTNSIYAMTASGASIFAGTAWGVIFSPNSGSTWVNLDSALGDFVPAYSIAVRNRTIFAGTDGGVVVYDSVGARTEYRNFGLKTMRVESLVQSGGDLFAGSSYNGVFRSTDNGATWNAVNSGLPNTFMTALVESQGTLFAANYNGGVFLSTNRGTIWSDFNSGLADKSVFSLAVKDGMIFAGTESLGVWQRPLSETGAFENCRRRGAVAPQTRLEGGVTGDAHAYLAVVFSVPRQGHVAITLHDLCGRTVASLFDRNAVAGSHSVQWDCDAVAHGCYVIKMRTGNETAAKIVRLGR
jgi:photosystem II stability/assembly factor-like uncharacterized protein